MVLLLRKPPSKIGFGVLFPEKKMTFQNLALIKIFPLVTVPLTMARKESPVKVGSHTELGACTNFHGQEEMSMQVSRRASVLFYRKFGAFLENMLFFR